MKYTIYLLGITCVFLASACSDEDIPSSAVDTEAVDTPEAWHDKIRTQPYPKLSNELYLNPPPLIVPQDSKTGEKLQFALSQDETFPDASTQLSEMDEWCMFNPHRELEAGTWYWRYRNISVDGSEGEWSEPIAFEVKAETPVFVTPDFATFRANIPQAGADAHPRLYCFLNGDWAKARQRVTYHAEYRGLIGRADSALKVDYSTYLAMVTEDGMEEMADYVENLHQAYLLTQDQTYSAKLSEILTLLCAHDFSDSELFVSNFSSTAIAYSILVPYDLLYNRLNGGQIRTAQELLMRIARHYYESYCGMQENHIFDNHFWQKNMRILFQIAFCLWDKAGYEEEASRMLEYYYELWTARAPASGFNRDGAWINGSGYLSANFYTLYYMPMLMSCIGQTDFLQHPWYQNAGQALAYNFPPSSLSSGFGDMSERLDVPGRQYAAFADFLARETGDGYAGWYANECSTDDDPNNDVADDVLFRIYRICRNSTYDTDFPESAPKMFCIRTSVRW